MQAQNDETMALVMVQYNDMSVNMEEEKKVKLEQLYDQIVCFQESIDSAKATLETTAREAETDARVWLRAWSLAIYVQATTLLMFFQVWVNSLISCLIDVFSLQTPEDIHAR